MLSSLPATPTGLRAARHLFAGFLKVSGHTVRGYRVERVSAKRGSVEVRGEWVTATSEPRSDAAVLYLHGSAYAICSSRTHRGLTTRLSQLTRLPVFACDYRLAPSHRFPAAADDVRAAYDYLLARGFTPDRIVVAGDSAGGHLAIDLVLQLSREGKAVPAALALFSPLIDLSFDRARERDRAQRDPMVSPTQARRVVDYYVGGADRSSPRLSLTVRATDHLPPLLVQVGGAEMLVADALLISEAFTTNGHACRLEVWRDQMHVFQALSNLIPEAEIALERAARFIVDELTARRTRSRNTSSSEVAI